ncbi:MAG: hypothetical protein CMM32_11765 [Rhodospirillaceae bacterium]|nr:hypothetical protein [Rhodospirillaceae bacterium]|tara:strand:+ start:1582 stop:3249 length:1668 start_codon:yes stop_codon:yes gene_type:complete
MKIEKELLFLPLGGAEEIGMNLNLYGFEEKWLMVDLGVAFGEDRLPGIDTIMPDPQFIVDRRKDLLGLVLTHGHEDHLGAIKYLWPQLRCPIYATPFTAELLHSKLSETNFRNEVGITKVSLGERFSVGPFDLEFISTTHSIPEPNAIALRTALGTVVHTGDFKIDRQPLIGKTFDSGTLSRIGDEGVLAVVCDSTNVFEEKESGSESLLGDTFDKIIGETEGIVGVTTFASNVARIKTIVEAAIRNDRHAVLIGRSLIRTIQVARKAGYLSELPDFISEKDVSFLPRDKVLLICTGSQGEPRGALSRISYGQNRNINLKSGDTIIFSSKIIPGNEKMIGRLQNRLSVLGVDVVTERDALVHVSGHPSKIELAEMYALTRPKIAIPVHGERRHIAEHAKLAKKLQIPLAIQVNNGSLVHLAPGKARVIDEVESGRLALNGSQVVPVDSTLIKERKKLMHGGLIGLTLLLGSKGDLKKSPNFISRGVFNDTNENVAKDLSVVVENSLKEFPEEIMGSDNLLAKEIKKVLRRVIKNNWEIKPEIVVEIMRIEESIKV